MHALALVLIDTFAGIGGRMGNNADEPMDSQVERIMAPWNMQFSEDGWWDDYTIGGRFAGRLAKGNVLQVSEILNIMSKSSDPAFYAIVSENEFHHRESWDGNEWIDNPDFDRQSKEMLQNHEGRVVIIDYHF